jgi:hypothetical protein
LKVSTEPFQGDLKRTNLLLSLTQSKSLSIPSTYNS